MKRIVLIISSVLLLNVLCCGSFIGAMTLAPSSTFMIEMPLPDGLIKTESGVNESLAEMQLKEWQTESKEPSDSAGTNDGDLLSRTKTMIKHCLESKNGAFFSNGYSYLQIMIRDRAVFQLKDPSSDFGVTLSVATVINSVTIDRDGTVQSQILPSTVYLAETFYTKEDENGKYLSAAYGTDQKPLKSGRTYIVEKIGYSNVDQKGAALSDGSRLKTGLQIVFFNELNYRDYFDTEYYEYVSGGSEASDVDEQLLKTSGEYDALFEKGKDNVLNAGKKENEADQGDNNGSGHERFIAASIGFGTGVVVCAVAAVVILSVRKRKKKAAAQGNSSDSAPGEMDGGAQGGSPDTPPERE